jgi:restriction endonuclease S subunit
MQSFIVWSDEIERRLDPYYLKTFPIVKSIKTSYHLISLSYLLKEPPQYGANEAAVQGDSKTDVRYIRITDIDEYGNLKDNDWKTAKTIENKYLLEDNDILFARSGATAGKTFIYRRDFGKAIFAGYLIRFRFDEKKVDPRYIFYYTQLSRYANWINLIQRPSGQPNINSEEYKAFEIPLPPLKVQHNIVQIMMSAYGQKKQMEAEAQKLLDSIDSYVLEKLGIKLPAVEDKMCFIVDSEEVQNNRMDAYYYQPKFEEVEKALEEGKYRIEKLKEFITKIHYGISIKNVYVDEGIPLLRILNLKPNKIDLRDVVNLEESKRKEIGNGFVYAGDLLISRSGSVGIVAVVPKEADGFAFGSFMIKFCVNDEVNKEYVSIWLNNKISKLLTGREKIGAIQGNITISTIENYLVPLPPLEIQNKIADEVKRRISEAERLEAEASKIVEEAKRQVEEMILTGKQIQES